LTWQERYKIIREELPHKMPIGIKRYCTEYEIGDMRVCASNELVEPLTADQMAFERYAVDNYRYADEKIATQPHHVVKEVLRRWIHHARSGGDLTYKEFTGGKPLYHEAVTYHNGV
jgi:hypothetical protein